MGQTTAYCNVESKLEYYHTIIFSGLADLEMRAYPKQGKILPSQFKYLGGEYFRSDEQ